ncbi:MAG: ArsA family ATPase [Cyanobacteria bacterium P01_A01_bin.45]
MALILTFLGNNGISCSKSAIATAKLMASQGKRVLLAAQMEPVLPLLLGQSIGVEPKEVAVNLQIVQFQTSVLLERSWEDVKKVETEYLKTPILKEIYGQELTILPGMDSALALNAIREYYESGKYDVIIYQGSGDVSTLQMLGMPESLSWYARRFKKVFDNLDLGRVIRDSGPLIQPLISAVFNTSWTGDNFSEPASKANDFLDKGKTTVSNPRHTAAFLVTSGDVFEVSAARFLWGSAQQIGLTVGGVINISDEPSLNLTQDFSPLPVTSIPELKDNNWDVLVNAMPDLVQQALTAPKPIEVDISNSQVRLFLPGFDKKDVKLSQSGPEVTIEAGEQRRNIFLPPPLNGKPVKGAKFQNSYLIISF